MPPNPRLIENLAAGVALTVEGGECLASGASPFQKHGVWRTNTPFQTLYQLDGAFMAAEGDEFIYHENLVFPAATTLGQARTALILGGGDGGSARRLLAIPSMARIVICELDQAVVDFSRRHLAAIHAGSLDDPRVHVHIQDAFDFLDESRATGQFDLILFDLTDPVGPAAQLYGPAFLENCCRALSPGGMLVLHTASPFYQPVLLRQLLHAVGRIFPLVRPYFFPAPLYGGWWGMACASLTSDPAAMSAESVDATLRAWGIDGLQYYNGAIHVAQFALPNFLRDLRTGSP